MKFFTTILLLACLLRVHAAYDAFIGAGQSNMVGQGVNNQSYLGSDQLINSSFTLDALADPTHPSGAGSVWPLVFSAVDLRAQPDLIFGNCGVSSTSITNWQIGGANYTALTNRAVHAAALGTLKCVLWWQGETDGAGDMSQAAYQSNVAFFAQCVSTNLAVPVMICNLQKCASLSAGQQNTISNAIVNLWTSNNVVRGPDLSDLATDDGYHLTSDANLLTAGNRWADRIVAVYYAQRVPGIYAGVVK